MSWTTPEGRQPPFVARTIPLRVAPERIAAHAARQAARGGRYLADLRQPHWDAERVEGAATPAAAQNGVPAADDQPRPAAVPAALPAAAEPAGRGRPSRPDVGGSRCGGPPGAPAPSFRELVDVDGAQRARWTPAPRSPARPPTPDALDLEILLLVARLGHVLSSHVHRRFQPARSLTTTQRRLKRLADAGWIARFQFHRADGGGVPMCCVIRQAGLDLLAARDRLPAAAHGEAPAAFADGSDIDLRRARREVHVAGWVLALQRCVGEAHMSLRGRWESVLSPTRRVAGRSVAVGPDDLRLPGGRVAHDFLRTAGSGERHEVEHFETVGPTWPCRSVRPAAAVTIARSICSSSSTIGSGPPPRASSSATTTSSPDGRFTRGATAASSGRRRSSCSCVAIERERGNARGGPTGC